MADAFLGPKRAHISLPVEFWPSPESREGRANVPSRAGSPGAHPPSRAGPYPAPPPTYQRISRKLGSSAPVGNRRVNDDALLPGMPMPRETHMPTAAALWGRLAPHPWDAALVHSTSPSGTWRRGKSSRIRIQVWIQTATLHQLPKLSMPRFLRLSTGEAIILLENGYFGEEVRVRPSPPPPAPTRSRSRTTKAWLLGPRWTQLRHILPPVSKIDPKGKQITEKKYPARLRRQPQPQRLAGGLRGSPRPHPLGPPAVPPAAGLTGWKPELSAPPTSRPPCGGHTARVAGSGLRARGSRVPDSCPCRFRAPSGDSSRTMSASGSFLQHVTFSKQIRGQFPHNPTD